MNRYRGLSLALALAAIVPMTAAAQTYKDDKYTREADKFIALAMTRGDDAARREMYQQALDALQEGFEREADNAKIWHVAGTAYIGLSDYAAADSCFDKATELYPDVGEELEAEREGGWMQAFQEGVALMDQEQYGQALAVMEAGEALYSKRPEGLLNMGSMYANLGEYAKAEDAFERAAAAAQGELLEKLDSASQESWKGYVQMATLNIAQLRGSQGVDEFTEGNYKAAAEAFRRALEVNPYSRDYLMNYVQATYAQAVELEDEIEADSAKLAEHGPRLTEIYAALQQDIPKVREYDPTNENVLLILVRAVRRQGDLTGDTLAGQQGALAILQEIEEIPIELVEMSIQPGDGDATVGGRIRNKKLEANAPVMLKVTLIGFKGETVGEFNVTVNVGDVDTQTPFEHRTRLSGQIAGWKYEVGTT